MSMTAMGIGLTQTAGKPDGSGGYIAIPAAEVAQYTQAPLGFTHLEPASAQMSKAATDIAFQSGDREWVYVWNASGADLTAGMVCARGPTSAPYAGPAVAANHPNLVLGVAQHVIPDGFCGFILRSGTGNVDLSAAVAVGDGIVISGAGTGGPGADTAAVIGVAAVATAVVGLGPVVLACKG